PTEFIPLAELTGLIIAFGPWVLRTACAQTRAWQEAGHAEVGLAVNISARQFQHPDLGAQVKRALDPPQPGPRFPDPDLTARGCQHAQGFLFGAPRPAEECASLLEAPVAVRTARA